MRLGVIDVGSNTVHLLVVDAHPGAQPLPAMSHKRVLRLSEHVTADGFIDPSGIADLTQFVGECVTIAEDAGISELMSFVTSAVREAPNGLAVLDHVREHTGQELRVLTGEEEARVPGVRWVLSEQHAGGCAEGQAERCRDVVADARPEPGGQGRTHVGRQLAAVGPAVAVYPVHLDGGAVLGSRPGEPVGATSAGDRDSERSEELQRTGHPQRQPRDGGHEQQGDPRDHDAEEHAGHQP